MIFLFLFFFFALSSFGRAVMMDEPRFAQPIPNVTVAVGRDANLPCVVEHLGAYKVNRFKIVHFRRHTDKSVAPFISMVMKKYGRYGSCRGVDAGEIGWNFNDSKRNRDETKILKLFVCDAAKAAYSSSLYKHTIHQEQFVPLENPFFAHAIIIIIIFWLWAHSNLITKWKFLLIRKLQLKLIALHAEQIVPVDSFFLHLLLHSNCVVKQITSKLWFLYHFPFAKLVALN